MMTQSIRDLENTFGRALALLARNWFIIVPGLVLGILGGALNYALLVSVLGAYTVTAGTSADSSAILHAVQALIGLAISVLVAIVQMAYVTGMAGGSWEHGRASFRDGWGAFASRALPLIAAMFLLFVLGFCAAALMAPTIYLSVLAYIVFFIYTFAAVIIGGDGPIEAIVESVRLAFSNFWPTLAVVGLIIAISWIGAGIGSLIDRVNPFAGGIVADILAQVIVAYATLVIVGEYLKLRNRPFPPNAPAAHP